MLSNLKTSVLIMKKIIYASLCVIIAFISCESETQKRSRKAVKELTSYVDSINKISPDYSDQSWQNIESGYKEKDAKAAALESQMTGSDKKELEDTRNKFMDYQSHFEAEKVKYDDKIAQEKKQKMLGDFFGEDKASDMSFDWINASNITDAYKKFVSKVYEKKETYTNADWDELKMIMDGLNKRRESIEKSLTNRQKAIIAEQKIKYDTAASIK